MYLTDQVDQTRAIRFLAGFTEQFRNQMSEMAVSYNINIITGSMPLLENDRAVVVPHRRDLKRVLRLNSIQSASVHVVVIP